MFSETMLIGVVIGFLIKSEILENKYEHFSKLRSSNAFEYIFKETVKPTDAQLKQLKPILEKYHLSFQKMRKRAVDEFKAAHDSLKLELRDILTEEQIMQLEKRVFSRYKNHEKHEKHENDDD